MKIPERLLRFIEKENNFLIATHINPDGDAIGSALALSSALEATGKNTYVYCRDKVPDFYRFLPGYSKFRSHFSKKTTQRNSLILLDCNGPERAAIEGNTFKKTLVIDHHETENSFGDIRWVVPDAAATGILVYYLIKKLGLRITKNMAVNLFTAISVDTGTFRYSNTSAEVLRVSADLVEAGAEPNMIAVRLYETWEKKRFELLILVLNTLEIRSRVAITYVTKDMFGKTGTNADDIENFSNFPRRINSVDIAALFREIGKDYWKASLRSKGDMNVAKIAEIFDGGGHRNAAGFRIKGDLRSVKETLLKAVRKSGVMKTKK